MTKPLSVVAINLYDLGHVSYHEMLAQTFAEGHPEIQFSAKLFPQYINEDLPAKLLHWIVRRPVPFLKSMDSGFVRLRSELANSYVTKRMLKRLLCAASPDVLHVHTQSLLLLSSRRIARIPTVVSLDLTTALLAKVRGIDPLRSGWKALIALEKRVFEAAKHIISFSDFARRSVIEDYGVAPERVTTVYPPTKMHAFGGRPRKGREGKVRILFVGNDFARKGGYDLLQAYESHLSSSCEVDIVSNGVPEGVGRPGVRLHRGVKPYSDKLMDLYAAADIYAMPTYEECLGHVYIEAMAAGLPAVATNVMAVPEVVRDGKTGLLVPAGAVDCLAQAISKLVECPEMRLEMGELARSIAKQEYDPAVVCGRTAAIYRQCAAR